MQNMEAGKWQQGGGTEIAKEQRDHSYVYRKRERKQSDQVKMK